MAQEARLWATGMAGAYTDQRLNLSKPWEGPRKKCQGFKPDPGNLAVRDYRGASGVVSHGEDGNPSGNRKSRNGNPSPTAERARFLSQSHIAFDVAGAGNVAYAGAPVSDPTDERRLETGR
jgi:hypothetical protein